jgi:histidyl-tRNA synthetase
MSKILHDKIEPRLLKGFRDILPMQMIARKQMIETVEKTLCLFGFLPLETPALEYADILLGKLGDEGEKLLYKFKDHGHREVAMRYDMTVPLARVVAQYSDLPMPFKRYQVGPVWRADNTQRGRYREFYQFDMDIVGTDAKLADAEILVTMQSSLQALGIKDFIIRVNDRKFLAQIAQAQHLTNDQTKAFYAGLDKFDKIGMTQVQEYWSHFGINAMQITAITNKLDEAVTSLNPLAETFALAHQLGLAKNLAKFDPYIVRGLDYYSGIVFETTLTNAPEYGSIFSGGRYDGLVGRFSNREYAAVGASIGVDRLLAALDSLQLTPTTSTTAKIYVTIFDDALLSKSLEITKLLRDQRVAVEMSYEPSKIGKQLKIASSKGIPLVIIIGPNEAIQDIVTLRNLVSGQEEELSHAQLLARLTPDD